MIGWAVTAFVAANVSAVPLSTSWQLQPKYLPGQEVVYDGRVHESRSINGVESVSDQRLTVRALVLEKNSRGVAKLGCCTILKRVSAVASKPGELDDALSIDFEIIEVEPSGLAKWKSTGIDGSPAAREAIEAELGFLVEFPEKGLKTGEKWTIRPEGEPVVAASVVGPESIIGTRCVAVRLQQESQNWANPDNLVPAWRLETNVWVDDKSKAVFQLERTYETRRPGGESVVRRVSYRQASNVRYHGNILQQQTSDFRTVYNAFERLRSAVALTRPAERMRELASVRRDLKAAMQQLYSTPHRAAIERIDQMAEAAESKDEMEDGAIVLAGRREAVVGTAAPSFALRRLDTGETVTRKTTKGKSIVMVFIEPDNDLSVRALQTVLDVVGEGEGSPLVFAICEDADETHHARLRESVPGPYVLCAGQGADGAYGIDGSPHVVFIDQNGILRINQVGFGPELRTTMVKTMSASRHENIADQKDKRSFLR